MSNPDKGTVEEIQPPDFNYENWNSGGQMPFDVPSCKPSHLVNSTLLAHGEKNGLLAWLWSTNLFVQWTPVHHITLQLSQLFLLTLFLLPNLKGYHRFLGLCYGVSMFGFGYFVLRSLDLITWSALHILINGIYLISSMCRVAGCTRSHSKELEMVYKQMFQKLHITRDQFNTILSCKKNTRVLPPNSPYAIEKTTRVDSLGLLLSGKLLVSQQGRPLHIILPFQFVDSPEYFGVSTDELFQVSITAVEESKVLIWHRDKLRLTIMSDEFLSIMFDHIIGRDVVRKLIQVSDTVTLPSNNGIFIPGSKEPSSEESDPMLETNNKDMSVVYGGSGEGGHGHHRGGPISSSFDTDLPRIKYFAANEVWSLTKIDEEMVQV